MISAIFGGAILGFMLAWLTYFILDLVINILGATPLHFGILTGTLFALFFAWYIGTLEEREKKT